MALNDIFTMIKADKYTQDGREELIKAQQAETEDKTYKPGEISETTGKQKQPDGSWKFPKQAGGKNAKKKEFNGVKINKKAEEQSKREGRTDILPSGINTDDYSDKQLKEYADGLKEALTTQNNFTEETRASTEKELKAVETVLATRNASKPAAKPTTEELSTFKDIVREYKKNPNKQTEQIMNEAKSHLMKNRGMTPEQLGKIGRDVMAESKSPEFKIQGMTKEQYIPWAMEAYKIPEWQAKSNWAHSEEQHKNKMKEKEYDGIPSYDDSDPLRDSAPRVLTGDCKIRIRK